MTFRQSCDEITLKKRLIFNPRTDKVEGFVDLGENQDRSSVRSSQPRFSIYASRPRQKAKATSSIGTTLLKELLSDIGYTVITFFCYVTKDPQILAV